MCQVIEQNHRFHLASFVLVKSLDECFSFLGWSCFGFEGFFVCLFGFFLYVQDHGIFLMDTDLIPPEYADQSVICPSIFISITCTNTHLKKVVSVSNTLLFALFLSRKRAKMIQKCAYFMFLLQIFMHSHCSAII